MCKDCNYKHEMGYSCPCECHQPIDTIIVERDKNKKRREE